MQTTQEEFSFALPRIALSVTQETEYQLNRTRRALNDCHNTLIKHANKLLNQLGNNKQYQQAKKEYGKTKRLLERKLNKKAKRDIEKRHTEAKKKLSDIQKSIGLSENDFQKWINNKRKQKYSNILNADACQKEATRVWRGVEKVLFGNGKKLHYRKWDDFHTIGSKKASSNVIPVRDDDGNVIAIKWNGNVIGFRDELNEYEKQALKSDIRYVEIEFLLFPDGYHYYATFSLKGKVPLRYDSGSGKCGLDPGPSTMAFASNDEVAQVLLAPNSAKYDEQIAKLQRRIDESVRTTNSDRFNEDGTCKRRKAGEPTTWNLSDNCRKMKRELKTIHRRKAETTKQSHLALARRIVSQCNIIHTENMQWSALAKRAKLSKDEHGRYKKRKHFGKSIGDHAPGKFMDILAWKCKLFGVPLIFVDQWAYRASQLNHVTGELTKMEMSERWKVIDDENVQRDLYASFLLKHSDEAGFAPDRKACLENFECFLELQAKFIERAIADELPRNSCFGF